MINLYMCKIFYFVWVGTEISWLNNSLMQIKCQGGFMIRVRSVHQLWKFILYIAQL